MRKIVRRFSIAALTALVGSTFGLASAAQAATTVSCGQIITTSITLANDIGPCLGDGLIVRGNNITINLAGHTVRGASKNSASAIDQAGIHLDGVSGVKVTGGTVREFFVGVLAKGGANNTITLVTVVDNVGLGKTLYNDGIILDGSTNNTVSYNRITGNGPDAGIALIRTSSNNRILSNLVSDNIVPSIGSGPGGTNEQHDQGINNNDGASSDNLFADNQILRNGDTGINMGGYPAGSRNQAIRNVIKNNGGGGINAGGNGHTVSGNFIYHNGYQQFLPVGAVSDHGGGQGVVTCGTPVSILCGPDPVTIQDNTITQNAGNGVELVYNGSQATGGCGIYGCNDAQPYSPPRSNLVQRNIVRDNGRDGIVVACDVLYDKDFNGTCLTTSPPHMGQRILNNYTSGNGGIGAGKTFWDLHDLNPGCDDDIWSGNRFVTANPPCTTG